VKSAQTKAGRSATGVVDTGTWIAIEAAAYPLGSTTTPPVPRIAGHDRYDTAAEVAEKFSPGVPVAFITSGSAFADALSGAAAAGAKRSPVLLSAADRLPAATAAALKRLQPQSIVVLGGTGTLSAAVEKALAAYTTGTVTRLWGPDRYSTAAAVSKRFVASGVDVAYIASGEVFADALAGAALAGARRRPVLLTTSGNSLPASTVTELKRLRPRNIVILGGTGSVSAAAATQAKGLTAGTVTRLAGHDRYETAQLIASQFNAGAPVAYVASGVVFTDALAGAALAARAGSAVVLVTADRIPAAAAAALNHLQADEVVVLGGVGTVHDTVASGLRDFAAS
jgi:putative cell wall-binding protein